MTKQSRDQAQRRQWVMAHWLVEALGTAEKDIQGAYEGHSDEERIEAIKRFRDWCECRIAEVDSVLEGSA